MICFLKYFLYFISIVAVLAMALIAYLMWFQPPFYFPKPTGPYAVGNKEYHWIDTKRTEIYSNDPKHPHRELMVKIWYPAQGKLPEKPSSPYAPYLVNDYKKQQKTRWFLFGFSRPIYSFAQSNILVATDKALFPIIIASHGFGCNILMNTAQCEELASHGYIVIGINHTYCCDISQLSNNRMTYCAPSIMSKFMVEDATERFRLLDQLTELWMADVRFVLDQLTQLNTNKESLFYQHLDLNHIGMFGHSMGGSTAIQMCRHDERIQAAVDMDGSLFGTNVTAPVKKPYMLLLNANLVKAFEHAWTPQDWKKFQLKSPQEKSIEKTRYSSAFEQLAVNNEPLYTFLLKNAEHLDFCDCTLYKCASPLLKMFSNTAGVDLGSIDGFRMTKIVNAYLVNFFDKYLKGKPSALLDGQAKQYAEVEVKHWKK